MSSMQIWSDEKSGVSVTWHKHAPAGVRKDGFIGSGYVIERNVKGWGPEKVADASMDPTDQGSAIDTARKHARSIIKRDIRQVLLEGRDYHDKELGLRVDFVGGGFVIDHQSRNYSRHAPRLRIGEFKDVGKASETTAKILVGMTDLKNEVKKLASNGEFPLNVRGFHELEKYFDLTRTIESAVEKIVPGKEPTQSQKNAVRWAMRHGLNRWLVGKGLEQSVTHVAKGVLPYEIRSLVASQGSYVHENLGLTITKNNRRWALAHPIMGDQGKIGETVIGLSSTPDWASSIIGKLDRIAFDGEVEIYSRVFAGELDPDATTPLSSPGFREWLEENVTSSVELSREGVKIEDPGQAYACACAAVANSLQVWMASPRYQASIDAYRAKGPQLV